LLNNSKNLLGTLLRSQKSDTWYLETAFYILSATIAWLVFRRLIYGPAWWLVWFPLKLFVGAWMRVLAAVGVFGGSSVDIGVSSAVGGQTIVHQNPARATVVGSDAPVIHVANDRSSSIRETDSPQDETLTEQVGRIIDDSQADQGGEVRGTADDEESTEGEPVEGEKNPKKRMWEEDKEAAKEAQRKKDEL
jgi:protein transport protein SEC20